MIKVFFTDSSRRFEQADSLAFAGVSPSVLPTVVLRSEQTYQEVLGFGAALTDAACYVISGLPAEPGKALIDNLFSADQMGLNVCRLAIGASDYARMDYSYAETPEDSDLRHFSIDYDRDYILPVIREARKSNPDLFFFSSPWSPPGWMKTGGSMCGGWMREKYLEVYARYFLKYLQAYAEAGVTVNAVTPQNETETDQLGNMPACLWHPEFEMSFARDYLAPLLKEHGLDTKVWIMDHNYIMWKRAKWMLDDPAFKDVVDGVAFHGYQGSPDMMTNLHEAHPQTHIYWTEGGPDLGDTYEIDWCHWGKVFTDAMRNWSRSVTAWNMALDEKGTPNIGPFPCAGLVTVYADTHQISYSGQYWAMAHFSKTVQRGAKRIGSSEIAGISNVAFANPTGEKVAVFTNPGLAKEIRLTYEGKQTVVRLPANSLVTLTWE